MSGGVADRGEYRRPLARLLSSHLELLADSTSVRCARWWNHPSGRTHADWLSTIEDLAGTSACIAGLGEVGDEISALVGRALDSMQAGTGGPPLPCDVASAPWRYARPPRGCGSSGCSRPTLRPDTLPRPRPGRAQTRAARDDHRRVHVARRRDHLPRLRAAQLHHEPPGAPLLRAL